MPLETNFRVAGGDGKRFLIPMPVVGTGGHGAVTVVQNWLAGARR